MKKLLRFFLIITFLYSLFLVIDLKKRQSAPDGYNGLAATSQSPSLSSQKKPPQFAFLARKKVFQSLQAAKQAVHQAKANPVAKDQAFAEKQSSSSPLLAKPARSPWEKQELPSLADNCPRDKDCTPRGRDGVLMMGASFAAVQPASHWQGKWELGNNADRSPMLTMK